VLALFAIPLGRTESRRGRSARVFVAILIYIVYRNLLGVARSWVQDGTLPAMPGLWLIHGIAIAVAIPLLIRDARR
jgi:lipopolysaccharide export system permease protein